MVTFFTWWWRNSKSNRMMKLLDFILRGCDCLTQTSWQPIYLLWRHFSLYTWSLFLSYFILSPTWSSALCWRGTWRHAQGREWGARAAGGRHRWAAVWLRVGEDMGKLQEFEIAFDKNKVVYGPGDSISGTVTVKLGQPLQCKGEIPSTAALFRQPLRTCWGEVAIAKQGSERFSQVTWGSSGLPHQDFALKLACPLWKSLTCSHNTLCLGFGFKTGFFNGIVSHFLWDSSTMLCNIPERF